MGAVAGCPISAVFDGDASLRSRPMRRILDPLEKMGARVVSGGEGGRLPLTLQGARDPLPITYKTPVASAQIKSAVLLAGLAAPGTTTVIESEASRDHTELMLKHFGADITSTKEGQHGRRITLVGQPELHGANVVVPADPSSAAFPVVAALIAEGSDVVLSDVMTNPLRTGLFTTLREMGASIEESEVRGDAGEPMAQLRVRASKLRGVEVPPERAPSMIDEYLVLAVAASFAEGTTIMRGLQELRVKESDRLEATAEMLRVNGVKVEVSGDDLVVQGRGHVPGGGTVATHMDHRIAMSALVMGCASDQPVTVDRHRLHRHQFPGFHSDDAFAWGRVFMIIAIDGPAASGKGTLGKRLAHHYGYRHLDTGVIYRAVAYALMQSGHDLRDEAARGCGGAGIGSGKVRRSRPEDPEGRRGRLDRLGDPKGSRGPGQFPAAIRRRSAGSGAGRPGHWNRDLPPCRREDLCRGGPQGPRPPPHHGGQGAGRGGGRGGRARRHHPARRTRQEPADCAAETRTRCLLAR
ncbi:hypothetical protein BRDID11002_64290 [Bradyrhizobium diazoefficiens]